LGPSTTIWFEGKKKRGRKKQAGKNWKTQERTEVDDNLGEKTGGQRKNRGKVPQ